MQERTQQRQERAQRARENRELRRLPPAQRAQRREDIRNAREQRVKDRATQRDQAQRPAQTLNRAVLTPEQRRAERTERLRERRDERAQRRREDRELRALPAAQRTQRRDDIRQARETRAEQRRQARENRLQQRNAGDNIARGNALTDQSRAARRDDIRRNGQARISRQAARQGRFAAALQSNIAMASANRDAGIYRARAERWAARRAWRQGLRAAFVPWYGPVFWPYAYSDIFYYSFWPGGYDDGYWYYAYDDFIDGLFWGEAGPPDDYVYADPPPVRSARAAPRVTYAAVQSVCKQPGNGVTAWPFAEIGRIGLNAEQKKLLDDVRKAAAESAAAFKDTCPSDTAFPLTPPGRLGIMTARLDATLEAVRTVRPALEAFYDSLNDEQKARFNQIGPKGGKSSDEVRQAAATTGKSCAEPKPGLANLPIEEIEDTVKPTEAQEAPLRKLEDATVKAVSILQEACPQDVPQTPTGRLELMEKRLQAMRDAANEVKTPLAAFYTSLSNEQKARFNTIGQTLARAGDDE